VERGLFGTAPTDFKFDKEVVMGRRFSCRGKERRNHSRTVDSRSARQLFLDRVCYANCIAHFCNVSRRVSAHPPFPELGLLDFQANAACNFSASQFASAGNVARAIRRYCEGALEQFWFDRRATVNV
jgi:hypothetical protein